MIAVVLITALIALAFSFTNGMNDAANCIASVIATKAAMAFGDYAVTEKDQHQRADQFEKTLGYQTHMLFG